MRTTKIKNFIVRADQDLHLENVLWFTLENRGEEAVDLSGSDESLMVIDLPAKQDRQFPPCAGHTYEGKMQIKFQNKDISKNQVLVLMALSTPLYNE